MILIVDYSPKNIQVWSFKEGHNGIVQSFSVKDADEIRNDKRLADYICGIAGRCRMDAISFRILFGGDYFACPAFVDGKFFSQLTNLTEYFPFYIPSTLEMLKRFRRVFRNAPLMAFFETSFFLKLSDKEKYYALPFEYHQNNKIRKWGFHGIFHEANAGIFPLKDKTVSIVFDKQTTVCAIRDKKPFSISLGYTPLEGIMSRTACGDLDPGVVFYLMNVHNFSIYEIDEMLKKESGFKGLTGYDVELGEMLKLHGRDDRVNLAFDVYCAQIMKHIGDGISAMGGVDNIIISGNNAEIFIPVIYNILKRISFLGINTLRLPWGKDEILKEITSEESRIKVYLNRMKLPEIIYHATEACLREGT